jgi:predicted DNA-binding WGR domain protein
MLAHQYHLYIERIDHHKNMARYYALEISETLFGEACVTRRWGRIGARGQEMRHQFSTAREAIVVFLDLARAKRMKGYRPRPTI